MSSRYHATRALPDLPLGWASPAPASGGLRLVFEHFRRRAAQRHQIPLPEGRLRYLLRSVRGLSRQAAWLRLVGTSRDMRAAAEVNPRLYERWQPHYISRRFDLDTRARIIESHYRFVTREFPERLRLRLLKGHDVRLATLPLGSGEVAYLHARAPESEQCGELGLFLLNADKEVISSCAVTFAGAEGILLGAMRGSWAYLGRGAIAAFNRATGGLHPRELLLAVVRTLAGHYGIDRIRGVAAADHPLDRRAGVSVTAYDRFWRRHGGMPGVGGCYDVPVLELPTGKPARDAFRREACDVVLKAFQKS
ncbi:VirK/YbjX family protein [Bacillus sp. NP157]|nr:VirK/YbjX family protein [Bacillus sp. NP157]